MHRSFLVPTLLVTASLSAAAAEPPAFDVIRPRALEVLRHELHNAEEWPKVHAAEALLQLGYVEGVEDVFRDELQRHGDRPEYRIGLEQLNPPARHQWLDQGGHEQAARLLESDDAADRREAARMLGRFGTPDDRGFLFPLLEDADADVRVSAAAGILRVERRVARRLSAPDWLVIAAYLCGMLLIGWYHGRRTRTAEDYLLGGRAMRSWMVGVSLFASLFSTVTYMARPGEIIRHGPVFVAGPFLAYPLVLLVGGWLIIPRFMKLRVTSANELLEARMGLSIRLLAAVMFLTMRLVWMAVIIYITTTVVLGPVLGLPAAALPLVALLLGAVTVVYTSSGGFKAVVLTDVIQTFILFLGAILTVVLVTMRLGGFGWFPTEWAPTWDPLLVWPDPGARVTVTGAFITVFLWYVCTLGSDQMAVQRYLSTRNVQAARRSLATSMLSDMFVVILLILVGFALLGFYTALPHHLADGMSIRANADELFPLFIVSRLPVGLSGLVVAALLAAAMSSLSSGLNSVCAVITVDFWDRFGRSEVGDRRHLGHARAVSWAVGAAVVILSLFIGGIEGNLLEVVFKTVNLLVAPLFVIFFMTLYVPWATRGGTWAAALASVATAVGIAYFELLGLSFVWIIPSSLVAGVVTGSLASLVLGKARFQ